MKLITFMRTIICLLILFLLANNTKSQSLADEINKIRTNEIWYPPSVELIRRPGTDSVEIRHYYTDLKLKWALADSVDFNRILTENGFSQINYLNDTICELIFTREKAISYNGRQLRLNNRFWQNAVIIKHKVDSTTKRIVIFVSDPHSYSEEIPYLRDALMSLIRANKADSFYFLNEGYYEGPSREVKLDSLVKMLPDQSLMGIQLASLSKQFIIDVAIECRMMLKDEIIIDEYAIDDNEAILNTLKYENSLANALPGIREEFNRLLDEFEKQNPSPGFYDTGYKVWLDDIRQLERFKTSLTNKTRKEVHDYLSDQIQSLRGYTKRDTVMAQFINYFLSLYQQKTPIVFIGENHLPGITHFLHDSIGYVMIGSRDNEFVWHGGRDYDDEEKISFDSLRFINSRNNAFEKFAPDTLKNMKIPVLPFKNEWKSVRRSVNKINNSISKNVSRLGREVDDRTAREILSSVKSNPHFKNPQLDFAPEGSGTIRESHPEVFGKMDENGIILYNDRRFNNNTARINFLRNVYISSYANPGTTIKYIDEQTGNILLAYFDGKAGCWYFIDRGQEGINMNLLKFNPNVWPTSKSVLRVLNDLLTKN